jgi:hypothetical protein
MTDSSGESIGTMRIDGEIHKSEISCSSLSIANRNTSDINDGRSKEDLS